MDLPHGEGLEAKNVRWLAIRSLPGYFNSSTPPKPSHQSVTLALEGTTHEWPCSVAFRNGDWL